MTEAEKQALRRRLMTETMGHINAALGAMETFPQVGFSNGAEDVENHLTSALDEATDWLARNKAEE